MERTARMQSPLHRTDARSKLLVTVAFLVTMLSVPLCRLPELLLFFVFPIVTCAMGGLSYGTIFRRSLVVLPFVAFIGVFNLFYDREPVFRVGALVVTAGWISFLSIVLRGLLSVQALLVLISSTGYYGLCRSMQRLGVPAVFTTQLLFVYRYLYVLIEEAAAMQQARDARSFGRKSYPLKVWGTLVGQLLIRTFDRAERISRRCSPVDSRDASRKECSNARMENSRYPVSCSVVLGVRPAALVPSGRKPFDADKQPLR